MFWHAPCHKRGSVRGRPTSERPGVRRSERRGGHHHEYAKDRRLDPYRPFRGRTGFASCVSNRRRLWLRGRPHPGPLGVPARL